MIPCELRPAATNSPSNSGTNPSWKFESGVKLSGARRKCAKPIDSSSGTRCRAAARAGAKWSQSGPNSANPVDGTADGAIGLPFGSNAPMTYRPRYWRM